MKMAYVKGLGGFLGIALFATGCEGGDRPAEPESAAAEIQERLPAVIDAAAGSFSVLEDSEIWASFEGSLDTLETAFQGMPFVEVAEAPTSMAAEAPGDHSPGEELAEWLSEHVFTEQNYEGNGVYRLRGADFCEVDEASGMPDVTCVTQFDAAEIRLEAVVAGDDGLDVTLILGPERSEPVMVELRQDSLAIAADLAEAKESLVHLASIGGVELELPQVMDGSFSVSLTRNGEEDTTIALAIRRPIRLEGAKADGTEFAFSTAAKNPLFGLRAQGIERRLSVDLDIGVTTINIPWNEFVEESVATAMADIDWKGLSGSVVLEDGMSNLVFSNLGFGDGQSTIKYDGQTVFALDLNKQTGRRADVTITPADPALPQFEISPELDLEMRWYLQPLADLGDEIESYLLDDSYRIKFGGSQPTIQPVAGSIETDSGALKVVSGNLTISATGTAAIVVDAGECLRGDDAVTPGEHEILGQLTVATCP